MKSVQDYRKIQKVGKGSYTITLPQDWMRDLGLMKGSHVALKVQQDSCLLVIPKEVLEKRKGVEESTLQEYRIIVNPEDDPQSVCRRITSLYVVSADLIHIRFKETIPPEHKSAISNLNKNLLLGSEIVDETSNEITLQILIKHPDFPVEKAIRRMSILALSANRDAILSLEKSGESPIGIVSEMCADIDRLNLYVIRQLKYGLENNTYKELGLNNPKEFLGYRIVAYDLKGVADNAFIMANKISTLKKMIKEQFLIIKEPLDSEVYSQIIKFNAKTHAFFKQAVNSLFKRDYKTADEIIFQVKPLLELENDLITLISMKKMDPNISSAFSVILDSSRRLVECGRNIAEITLNRTIEETGGLVYRMG